MKPHDQKSAIAKEASYPDRLAITQANDVVLGVGSMLKTSENLLRTLETTTDEANPLAGKLYDVANELEVARRLLDFADDLLFDRGLRPDELSGYERVGRPLGSRMAAHLTEISRAGQ